MLRHSVHVYKYWHNENKTFDTKDTNKYHNLRSVEAGRLIAVCQNKVIEVNKGEMLYIPPERYADIKVFAEPYCNGTVLKLRYFPNEDDLSFPPQSVKINDEIIALLKDIPNYGQSITCNHFYKTYKALDLIQANMTRYTDKNILKLQKALEFMRKNDNYTIQEAAAYCDMSHRRFNAVFKEVLNLTPIQMKQKLQATKAELLLKKTDLSIDEIAKQIGYSSTNQLRSILKKRCSSLPKKIRTK